jgi:hypothetical protein
MGFEVRFHQPAWFLADSSQTVELNAYIFYTGEALNSICTVSKEMQIVTKTKEDAVAKLYDLDVTGSIVRYMR